MARPREKALTMRFRLMATYRGVPYEAGVGPGYGDVVLFAACPPPEELGFEPAPGHWRKQVIRAEIDALWESRPVGHFRGDRCVVLDDLGDRLHIAYLGTDPARAAELGYWQVDRGVFELLTPREEITGLAEERRDMPLQRASSEGGPAPAFPNGAPSPFPPSGHGQRNGTAPPEAGGWQPVPAAGGPAAGSSPAPWAPAGVAGNGTGPASPLPQPVP
ncbi:MAG: hypothetical protein LBI49_04130, partial [Nocardiopsaceae bacterium]|nr:hypothetical protein [Nocardiopsaceae bacterium]